MQKNQYIDRKRTRRIKVGLFQVDGTGPNLALMKLAGHYKAHGHKPVLNAAGVYNFASCIFTWNRDKVLSLKSKIDSNIIIGGYGVSDAKLREDAEHCMPDYSLYGIDYSMGYTTRGCIRACPWCVVPKMEGFIRHNASIYEFWDPTHTKLSLLDNNFFTGPFWQERVAEIEAADLEVCFSQGLDIRLINEEQAAALKRLKFKNRKFKSSTLYFAFDRPEDETMIRRGIKELTKAGIPNRCLMFFVLVGFDTTFEEDMDRCRILMGHKCYPYVMIYNKEECTDIRLKQFARWINRYIYKVCRFEDYEPSSAVRKMKGIR